MGDVCECLTFGVVPSVQVDATHRKEALKAMTETFYAALFGYDEVPNAWSRCGCGPGCEADVVVVSQGVLSDDRVLAAALWRNLFNCECEDPRQLELLVQYVRKQVGSTPSVREGVHRASWGAVLDWVPLSDLLSRCSSSTL